MTKTEIEIALTGLPSDGALIAALRKYRPWTLDKLWWKKRLDDRIRKSRRGGRHRVTLTGRQIRTIA